MTHTFRRRIAVAALALPLVLASCADDEPVPQMPKASTPTTAATETVAEPEEPVEPTLPPEAVGTGIKAAEAFVRHYYDTVNYAQATGDTDRLRELGSIGCEACKGGADVIDMITERGGQISGGTYTVELAEVTGRRNVPDFGTVYYLAVRVVGTKQSVTGARKLNGNYGGGTTGLRFEVARGSNGFQVTKWYER